MIQERNKHLEESFKATQNQDPQNIFRNPELTLTFGGADGVQGIAYPDKSSNGQDYSRGASPSVSSNANSNQRGRNNSDNSKRRLKRSRRGSGPRSQASKYSNNRTVSANFSEKTIIDQELDECIRKLRTDHAKVKGELDEEFKYVNVCGIKREFDVGGPAEADSQDQEQQGEKIFSLAGKVRKATTPVSNLRKTEQPKNAAASFLAEEDDIYEGLRAPENKCWICENSGSKGKFKECDFCGQSSCQACVEALRRFPRQLIIPNASDEPARAPCCNVCVAKLFMGELYLGLPQAEGDAKESLKSRIAKREEKLSGRHADLRQRQRELAQVHRANLQFTDEMNAQEAKYKEKEHKTEQEIRSKEVELTKLKRGITNKEDDKAKLQQKLDMLRKDEAGYFERNAALERTIDEQRRWNEQLRNEFECLNDAIKNELALQQQPEHCPSFDKAQMEEVDQLLTTRDMQGEPPAAKTTNIAEPASSGLPTVEESFGHRQSNDTSVARVDKNSAFSDPRSSRNGSRIEQSKQTVMTEDVVLTEASQRSPRAGGANNKRREIPRPGGKPKKGKGRDLGGQEAAKGGCCAGGGACVIF